jgi:hypothetical protein
MGGEAVWGRAGFRSRCLLPPREEGLAGPTTASPAAHYRDSARCPKRDLYMFASCEIPPFRRFSCVT